MGEDKPVKDSPLGVVTYMTTSRKDDISSLMGSLRSLSNNFLSQHRYPVSCCFVTVTVARDAGRGGGGGDW